VRSGDLSGQTFFEIIILPVQMTQ